MFNLIISFLAIGIIVNVMIVLLIVKILIESENKSYIFPKVNKATKTQLSQFVEPISGKEKFDKAKNVSDLLS